MAECNFTQADHGRLVLGSAGMLLVVSLLVHILLLRRRRSRRRGTVYNEFPGGPPAWPVLGHLPLLASGCPHHTLSDLTHKHGYGPIIGLRLGSQHAVVISNASLARECLLTHDKSFSNRPRFHFTDALLYGFNNFLSFSSYGPQFSRFRKLYTLELFTVQRLHELQYIRQAELHTLLQRLRDDSASHAVDLGACFVEAMINTMSRLLQSKRLSQDGRRTQLQGCDSLPHLVQEFANQVLPTLGDFIPFLKFADVLQDRKMRSIQHRLDKLLENILHERRQAMQAGRHDQSSHDQLPPDLLQVLLSKEAPKNGQTCPDQDLLTTQQIKGIMMDILLAGSHTTGLTLEWAMAELLRNPRCLERLRDEIDGVMGEGDALITDDDLPKLPYLESTVKEVLRLHPVIPLLLPHVSSEATTVHGYTLPKDTQMFVNVWALGRDPHVWEEAERFLPERFQSKDMDVKGHHYDLLPFGSGRRSCPGLRLGMSSVQVTLANLVKRFDWELPQGQTHTDIDMSEKRGISNGKATPLLAIPKPRLPW